MTVPFPLDHFDNARTIKPRRQWRLPLARERLAGIAVTAALHVVVIAGLMTMVHVAPSRMLKELSVHILPQQEQKPVEAAPPPAAMKPAEVTAVMPDIQVPVQAAPVVAQVPPPAQSAPVPPQAVVAPHAATGDGRASFAATLLAHINRFKQYPPAARKAHITGTVSVHFVMDRQGNLLLAEVAKSSGRPMLDDEAVAMMKRAQPLPPLPADMPGEKLDAVIGPIDFSLN